MTILEFCRGTLSYAGAVLLLGACGAAEDGTDQDPGYVIGGEGQIGEVSGAAVAAGCTHWQFQACQRYCYREGSCLDKCVYHPATETSVHYGVCYCDGPC